MTKNKRFNFNLTVGEDEHKGLVFDNGQIMKTIDVVHLLNKFQQEVNNSVKLATENVELEDMVGRLEEKNVELEEVNRQLKEENEWLKKSIKRQQSSNEKCSKYIEEVVKENEQLKSTNMEMEDYLGRLEERIIKLEKENQEMNKK